jgi:unsaturated rhamnogalacturonyl hydrolase
MAEEDRLTALRQAADTLITLPYEAWHFGDSVAFEAMIAASEVIGDERYRAFAHGFVRAWEASRDGYRPLDCTAAGLAICRLYEWTGDPLLLQAAIGLARYLTDTRRLVRGVYNTWERSPLRHPYGPVALPPQEAALVSDPGAGVFVDCLHFDPPFLTALGQVTGDPRWTELGLSQAVGYVDLLQDSRTGLFHHFYLERTDRRYVLGWGRGQGWALLGLLEVVERAPSGSARDRVLEAVQALCAAMRATQQPDGHWAAVVDEPASGPETSTAAFMALGFRRAVRLGIVPASDYAEPAERALAAALAAVDRNGVLTGVSAAVWACTARGHYGYVPTGFVVPWGQGPLVLAMVDALTDQQPAAGS